MLNLNFDLETMAKFDTIIMPAREKNNYYFPENRVFLYPDIYFVFGSNLAGRHVKGTALEAYHNYGAVKGLSTGFMGRSYGIPTKDEYLRVLNLAIIKKHIDQFVEMTNNTKSTFFVTAVGTELAGFKHKQIAPLFKNVKNCWLPYEWRVYIEQPIINNYQDNEQNYC
jgi:hypothetical protein